VGAPDPIPWYIRYVTFKWRLLSTKRLTSLSRLSTKAAHPESVDYVVVFDAEEILKFAFWLTTYRGLVRRSPKLLHPSCQLSLESNLTHRQTHTMPEKAVVNSVLSSHAPCRPKRHHHYWHRHRYLTVCVRQKCRGVNGACWCFSLGGGNPGNCHNFLHHVTHSKWQDEVSGNI